VPRFEGKVAIVTGGGSGIGHATAARLASEGAAVGVADLNGDAAGTVADEIRSAGGRALPLTVDVSDEGAVEEMVAKTVEEFGGLDVLHNNAAIVSPEFMKDDVEIARFERRVFDTSMEVNVLGPVFGCKYAIPRMIDRGGGAIVNTASVAALRGNQALPVYGMTKAAVVALTMYVATQYGDRGIRCNAVAPGSTASPTYNRTVTDERRQGHAADALIHRVGEPADIAAAVAYLASDDAAWVTAQTLVVDGGRLSYFR
jgi:NAD(P)-dependent dehydrogenase (short-subunit alcohol dehydrogenase family)